MAAAPGSIRLGGHTLAPRHQAIPATNDALNDCGVILEDIHEYSNRMTTYRFEIAQIEVPRLVAALTAAGFVFEGDDPSEAAAAVRADADGFIRATLQLTFPAEDGNRRNPNPDRG